MRQIISTPLSLIILLFLFCRPLHAQVNIDNIFCLGNGHLAAYETKADIIQLFGPPYSSPSLLQMTIFDTSIVIENKRRAGTAIWKHILFKNGKKIGTITDFVDSKLPCLVRKIDIAQPVVFSLEFGKKLKIINNSNSYKNSGLKYALLAESPRDNPFYNDYMMPFKQYMQMGCKNNISVNATKDNNIYRVECEKGKSTLYFIGGPKYPECITNSEKIFSEPYDTLINRTENWWNRFTSRRFNFSKIIHADVPERKKLLKTIDDVSVLIKTQQSAEGGIIAGHNYHLAYIRDEYGVSRCLLALGYYKEAGNILNYYWNIFRRKGVLHNAQGIGIDAFHLAENDDVEITAYLIIQSFDYLFATKDTAFVKKIFPMLDWAWKSQTKNLFKYMLPFNGDETYVAGGVLPRNTLNDGSAEATMLFIRAGILLLPFIGKYKLWSKATININRIILKKTEEHYNKNFLVNGLLATNNPARTIGLKLPEFRYGVCEELGKVPGCEFFGWTQKTKNNRYLCPVCFAKRSLPKVKPHKYFLHTVSLMPLYIGSDLFNGEELRSVVNSIIMKYNKTGRYSSRSGEDITVGYDYGLLLYNLVKLNNTAKTKIYKKMMSLLDKTGAWVEYYKNNKPEGTRYRPWESSISLEAAILYAKGF